MTRCVAGLQWRVGVLAGAAAALAACGALLALAGLPLNKNLYSGSYVLLTGGLTGVPLICLCENLFDRHCKVIRAAICENSENNSTQQTC